MQFMLILSEIEAEFAKRAGHPDTAAYWGGWNAFIGAMAHAGIIVKGDALQGPRATETAIGLTEDEAVRRFLRAAP